MMNQPLREPAEAPQNNRGWYVLITLLLLVAPFSPWFNGLAPATNFGRLFNLLPSISPNILFAFYMATVLLFGWMALAMPKAMRPALYRFWLAFGSFATCLILADLLEPSWGLLAVGIVLITAAFAELAFLFGRG